MGRSLKIFKKRRYHGKPYKKSQNNQTPIIPTNESSPMDNSRPSSSSKKLSNSLDWYETQEKDDFEYTIMDLKAFEHTLNNVASCKDCSSPLTLVKSKVYGLACEITLKCKHCENKEKFENCQSVVFTRPKDDKSYKLYDLNIRLTLGLRMIGKGKIAATKLCGAMNLGQPIHRFFLCEEYLGLAAANVCKESMVNAVLESVELNNKCSDIAVAVDGSWQRRGHKSLNGVLTATSLINGKVVDVEIMSKFCKCKDRLHDKHTDHCEANFSGSSGAMEVAGAVNIFQRSTDQYAVRYLEYLGDGDSKAYSAVCESMPYGNTTIEKVECIGHVQKRMGSRLKALKLKTKKLPNEQWLGGKGRLTDTAILQIQNYYGLAIRRNCTVSVENMHKAIWAEYFHILSSNEDPQHELCDETWCKYRLAIKNKEHYDHNQHFHLPPDVMSFIKPVFRDLSDKNLLARCLKGQTQNQNESFNSVVWNHIPKTTFVHLRTLKLGINMAVCSFNDGGIGICKILINCGLKPGNHLIRTMKQLDLQRIKKADKAQEELEKKIRHSKSLLKRKLDDKFEEEEGEEPSYGAGLY